MSIVAQKQFTLPGHLSSSPIISGARVAQSLVFYVDFLAALFVFLSFLANILSVLRFTASDYFFGISRNDSCQNK